MGQFYNLYLSVILLIYQLLRSYGQLALFAFFSTSLFSDICRKSIIYIVKRKIWAIKVLITALVIIHREDSKIDTQNFLHKGT